MEVQFVLLNCLVAERAMSELSALLVVVVVVVVAVNVVFFLGECWAIRCGQSSSEVRC